MHYLVNYALLQETNTISKQKRYNKSYDDKLQSDKLFYYLIWFIYNINYFNVLFFIYGYYTIAEMRL